MQNLNLNSEPNFENPQCSSQRAQILSKSVFSGNINVFDVIFDVFSNFGFCCLRQVRLSFPLQIGHKGHPNFG